MAYISGIVYSFFYIDEIENREYIGFCTDGEFEDYLNELLAEGYSMADLTWDTVLWEDELPDYPE